MLNSIIKENKHNRETLLNEIDKYLKLPVDTANKDFDINEFLKKIKINSIITNDPTDNKISSDYREKTSPESFIRGERDKCELLMDIYIELKDIEERTNGVHINDIGYLKHLIKNLLETEINLYININVYKEVILPEKQHRYRFFIPYYDKSLNDDDEVLCYCAMQLTSNEWDTNISVPLSLLEEEPTKLEKYGINNITDLTRITIKNYSNLPNNEIKSIFETKFNEFLDFYFLHGTELEEFKETYSSKVQSAKGFAVSLYVAKEGFQFKEPTNKTILWVGDAIYGVNYFSGSGVNSGIAGAKYIIDTIYREDRQNTNLVLDSYNQYIKSWAKDTVIKISEEVDIK